MGLFDFLFGSGDKLEKVDTMNPQQNQFLSQLLSQLGGQGGLGGQGSPFGQSQNFLQMLLSGQNAPDYDTMEAPYLRQFNEQTIPGLAERFASYGGESGALSSSGFAQALGSAGAGLQENLASMRQSALQNYLSQQLQGSGMAQSQFGNLAQMGLGAKPFDYVQKQGSPGFLPQALGSFLGSATSGGLGGLLGGLGGLLGGLGGQGQQANRRF